MYVCMYVCYRNKDKLRPGGPQLSRMHTLPFYLLKVKKKFKPRPLNMILVSLAVFSKFPMSASRAFYTEVPPPPPESVVKVLALQ